MRIAVLSDIHANLEAFDSVLKRIEEDGIGEILCTGDLVGYGADPNECVERVKKCSSELFCETANGDSASLASIPRGQRPPGDGDDALRDIPGL